MATFAVLISGSPYSTSAHHAAQKYIDACYKANHQVISVFFYSDACYVANAGWFPANDELNLQKGWIELAHHYGFSLKACVSVASKRGLIGDEDLSIAPIEQSNVHQAFEISGLGSWVEATQMANRVVQFNG